MPQSTLYVSIVHVGIDSLDAHPSAPPTLCSPSCQGLLTRLISFYWNSVDDHTITTLSSVSIGALPVSSRASL
eukprot:scaffold45429_cov234-Skeletonema_marinoi.AAC.1